MGDDYSNGTTGDTLELFKAEREDLDKTVATVRQMARDFDTLTEQRRLFDPNRIAFLLQLKGSHLKLCVWKGFFTPEAFQWHKEALARKKALGEQVLQDTTAFAHALIRWAENLEKRELAYQSKTVRQIDHDPVGAARKCIEAYPDVASAAYTAGANADYLSHFSDPPQSLMNACAHANSEFGIALERHGIKSDDEMYNLADWVQGVAQEYFLNIEAQREANYAKNYPVSHAITSTLDEALSNPVVQAALIVLPGVLGGNPLGPEAGPIREDVIPQGFPSADQFNQANAELQIALTKSGITDARIGVRGSSVTGFSYTSDAPFGPASDIDYFVESSQLTQGLKTSSNIPGFVHPDIINANFDAISEWSEIWSQNLGRKVTVGGFQLGTAPSAPIRTP